MVVLVLTMVALFVTKSWWPLWVACGYYATVMIWGLALSRSAERKRAREYRELYASFRR